METLEKYGFLEKLGKGTLGAIYKAYDTARKRQVAIRTFTVDASWDATLKERFSAECLAIAGLRHPNIAAIYEYGEESRTAYVVTEFLPGKDLKTLISENTPLTIEQKLSMLIQVAKGLGHAHAQGVLHRNLQPTKIFIMPDGTAKIADFGMAGLLSSSFSALSVQQGSDIYLAPEQVQGKEATRRSDIFCLGLLSYEFLTGVHPFRDSDSSKTLDNILHQTNFPTVEKYPQIPLSLWLILERALAKDAEERYSDAVDFGAACRSLLEELAEDAETMRIELQTALPRLRQAARRQGAPAALAKLQGDVEGALHGGEKSDYQLLNRLLAEMAEKHDLLHSAGGAESASTPELLELWPENSAPTTTSDIEVVETPIPIQSLNDPSLSPPPDVDSGPKAPSASPLALTDSITGQGVTAGGGSPEAEADVRERKLQEHVESQTPLVLPDGIGKPLPANSPSVAGAKKDLPAGSPVRKDLISELLMEIDEGQDMIQKRVESFLTARQAKEIIGAENPSDAARVKDLSTAGRGSPQSKQDSLVPEAETGTRLNHPQPQVRQAGRNRTHTQPSRAAVDGIENIPPVHLGRERGRTTLWICSAALLLTLAFAIPTWVRNPSNFGTGWFRVNWWRQAAGTAQSPSYADANDPIASAIRDRLNFARRDILLEEAQVLHAIGRRDESKIFLKRLLEIYPLYQPAMQELKQIEAESDTPNKQEDQQQPLKQLLESASIAIRGGRLQKARTDLDKAEQLQPGNPEVAALRRRLDAKNAELAQNAARELAKQQEAAQKQRTAEILSRRTEELYRLGKYEEALVIVDEHLAQDSQSPLAQDLRSRTAEMQRSLRAYDAALSAGKHADALAALEKLERLNPADPNLSALRRRAEASPVSGSASLSLYPIGETAALLFDDQPVGANGELASQTVPIGRHKLSAKNSSGLEVALYHEFLNGQKVVMVYDVARQVFRPMTEADRELMRRNKAKQQVHRFDVEHTHGLFRGSCKGDLIVDYYDVVYRPSTGSHGFRVPFKNLKLKVNDKAAVLSFATDNRELSTFKLADAQTAQALKKLWDDLTALDK